MNRSRTHRDFGQLLVILILISPTLSTAAPGPPSVSISGSLLGSVIVADTEITDACQVPGLDAAHVEQARRILSEAVLIDGHNDLPWEIRERFGNRLSRIDLNSDLRQLEKPTHTDLPRLRQGRLGAQFWSVYVPVDLSGSEAVQAVVEQIDTVHLMVEHYPDTFEIALTAADIERVHAAGQIASLIGIEGGHSIGNSLGVLRQLYALGARYMTVAHWQNHDWADSATDEPQHDGLAPFGGEVIREMNRLGMLVDLSHVSEKTMHDVLDISAAPVIFSHSSVRRVTPHARNVPDSVLARVKKKDGVVMVTFVPSFVSEELRQHDAAEDGERARLAAVHLGDPAALEAAMTAWEEAHPPPRATLSQVADHIDGLRDSIGIAHIGIGSDFDGISSTPRGLEDVSCFPALFAELLRRGYREDDLRAIAGGNVLRVMRSTEKVAARLRGERVSTDKQFEDF